MGTNHGRLHFDSCSPQLVVYLLIGSGLSMTHESCWSWVPCMQLIPTIMSPPKTGGTSPVSPDSPTTLQTKNKWGNQVPNLLEVNLWKARCLDIGMWGPNPIER